MVPETPSLSTVVVVIVLVTVLAVGCVYETSPLLAPTPLRATESPPYWNGPAWDVDTLVTNVPLAEPPVKVVVEDELELESAV